MPPEARRVVLTPFADDSEHQDIAAAVYDAEDRAFRFTITPAGELVVSPAAVNILEGVKTRSLHRSQ